ncbi:MAG: substrate-binding domain-containing protein [Candidatus Hinthialibacter antarcticus]|nr:substrate-binding domain-containing protein [Candidatus Hinthialibacter antarcticus]
MTVLPRFSLFLAFIGLFIGCSEQKPAPKAPAPMRTYTLSICPSSDDISTQAIQRGAQREIEHLLKTRVQIDLRWQPVPANPEEQAAAIRALKSQGVQGAAISCLQDDAVKQAIDEVVEGGASVITFQHDSPDSKRSSFFGIRALHLGGLATRVLEKELNGAGSIGILADSPSSAETAEMIDGANKRLEAEDNALRLATIIYCEGDPQRAWQQMREAQQSTPGLSGWLWLGPWPLMAPEPPFGQLQGAKVVSLGLSRETLPFLQEQKIHALIGRDYEAWGAELVRILIDVVDGTKTFREQNWVRPTVLTQDIIKRNRLKAE